MRFSSDLEFLFLVPGSTRLSSQDGTRTRNARVRLRTLTLSRMSDYPYFTSAEGRLESISNSRYSSVLYGTVSYYARHSKCFVVVSSKFGQIRCTVEKHKAAVCIKSSELDPKFKNRLVEALLRRLKQMLKLLDEQFLFSDSLGQVFVDFSLGRQYRSSRVAPWTFNLQMSLLARYVKPPAPLHWTICEQWS